MTNGHLRTVDLWPYSAEILSSSDDVPAVVLEIEHMRDFCSMSNALRGNVEINDSEHDGNGP